MKRRLLALLLAVGLTFSVTACGGDEKSTEVEVTEDEDGETEVNVDSDDEDAEIDVTEDEDGDVDVEVDETEEDSEEDEE